ncbi:unnamed protein product [Prorocentrum cordatum]|uniref:Alpha-type protein kinase domain-containing protein n=1 Tax=Prorocentrum cordatum TaxID=2364126 RepID=A0ABN9W071_9DINO|nr:unnamed protein product [Polarella glacialis]
MANSSWAAAMVGFRDSRWLDAAAAAAVRRIGDCSTLHLAQLAFAFSRFTFAGERHGLLPALLAETLRRVEAAPAAGLRTLSNREKKELKKQRKLLDVERSLRRPGWEKDPDTVPLEVPSAEHQRAGLEWIWEQLVARAEDHRARFPEAAEHEQLLPSRACLPARAAVQSQLCGQREPAGAARRLRARRTELERVDHELHEQQALPKAGPLAGELSAALGGMRGRLLKAAKSYKAQTDWSTFAPSEPVVAVKHFYDVSEDSWVEETVMVEIDSKPFGHGALRECFRMREVPMRVDGHFSRQRDEDEVGTPKSANIQDTVAAMMQISNKTKRRCWVAKRSTTGHGDLEKHKQDCLADAALQQVAKHHAEAFNSARRSIGHVPAHIGMHEVDFLMSHVIELPDGSTYGVEAFVFGHYEKYNNNSGGVMRPLDWVTPQAFSYFTFVHSGYRQMVVDIQGVDDIFTDPVLHYLPEHNRFALFLWSHRRNPIDKLLGLATFPHAVSEQRAVGGVAGLTVAHLATVERPPPAAGLQRAASAQPSASPTHHSVPLADVPGVNLQVSSWSGVRARGVGAAEGHALPLDLVLAACHMELALMYNEGRIGEGNDKQSENEAAVFHLVLAAREGLMEAEAQDPVLSLFHGVRFLKFELRAPALRTFAGLVQGQQKTGIRDIKAPFSGTEPMVSKTVKSGTGHGSIHRGGAC